MNYIIRHHFNGISVAILLLWAVMWFTAFVAIAMAIYITFYVSSWALMGLIPLICLAIALALINRDMIREMFLK